MMRTRKRMILAAVATCLLIVLGIVWYHASANITEESFTFEVIDPKTEIKVGENVSFTARLTNLTNRDLVLSHGMPLISLYIRPEGETFEKGIIGSTLVQTTLRAHQYTESEIHVEAAEAGNYVLGTYCFFEIDGKEYRYECEDILVKVTEE